MLFNMRKNTKKQFKTLIIETDEVELPIVNEDNNEGLKSSDFTSNTSSTSVSHFVRGLAGYLLFKDSKLTIPEVMKIAGITYRIFSHDFVGVFLGSVVFRESDVLYNKLRTQLLTEIRNQIPTLFFTSSPVTIFTIDCILNFLLNVYVNKKEQEDKNKPYKEYLETYIKHYNEQRYGHGAIYD